MTSAFTVAVECEGFLPLDPRDPENLDRKADMRDRAHNPNVDHKADPERERRRKWFRKEAEKQRKDLLDVLRGSDSAKLIDETIRDDGTAILYFEFDPGPEGDHATVRKEVQLDGNFDPKKGSVVPGRRVVVREPDEKAKGEGAKTWDSAVRNEVEQARSTVVGAGLQVVECRVEAHHTGKPPKIKSESKPSDKKETEVSDPGDSTHQETQRRSVEPTPEEAEQARREEAEREQERQRKEAEKAEKQNKRNR
jgi:hypothetical protein